MSKRAKEAACKTYPTLVSPSFEETNKIIFTQMDRRVAYIAGYEQAEKETIERAVMWLKEHADEYNGSESAFDHMEEEMITDFRKAMEEENG